jgi:hypothetical protein
MDLARCQQLTNECLDRRTELANLIQEDYPTVGPCEGSRFIVAGEAFAPSTEAVRCEQRLTRSRTAAVTRPHAQNLVPSNLIDNRFAAIGMSS